MQLHMYLSPNLLLSGMSRVNLGYLFVSQPNSPYGYLHTPICMHAFGGGFSCGQMYM